MIQIKKGLDIPITGSPSTSIEDGKKVTKVAINGLDYVGMKPTMLVQVGDQVKIGQPLFACKKVIGVNYTSPGAGKVIEINRGARRVLQTVVVELDGSEDRIEFSSYNSIAVNDLSDEQVESLLVESGLWNSFKTRPFSKAPELKSRPRSIFINVMDTNPLAMDPNIIVTKYDEEFKAGVVAISKLSKAKTYVCIESKSRLEINTNKDIEVKKFSGPHPAGNVGTHIHFVDPVNLEKMVWSINYQDVIAIGKLFQTGKLWTDRYIALGGPGVKNPRILKTRLGAKLSELLDEELAEGNMRVISGSILNGLAAEGPMDYLGRYNSQVSVIREGDEREFLGWMALGAKKFSLTKIFLSSILPGIKYDFSTSTNGSARAIVPIGQFEKVMPLDVLATPLLLSLITKDSDKAQLLGALEMDEEDLALCTFLCSGKTDYGVILRENLTTIEKEG